ncbi:MAG: glycosyltransferase family 1 protein [Bacteroidales bacterium]
MRIGFDAKRAYFNKTGLGNYSRSTINSLSRLFPDNKYTLYTPSVENNGLYLPPINTSVRKPVTIWSRNLNSYWRSYGIVSQLTADGIQLFHGLSNELPLGLGKTRIKTVVTIHDLIFLRLPGLYPAIDRYIYHKKVMNAVKSADRIIAISEQTRNDLIELMDADEKKVKIIYQGCNPWFYEKVSEKRQEEISRKYNLPGDYLLYVGTIEERKELLTIIRAIHEHTIRIPLVVIGRKTAYFDQVKKYMDAEKVQNIHFHQHVENSDLPAIYQQAGAFIYPSRYEGFGIPVLEALNSGIPVITSRGGCLEETAGKGGLFTDPGNVEELADAIIRLTGDQKLRKKLITAGTKHAMQFREEKTVPQLIELYKACLS